MINEINKINPILENNRMTVGPFGTKKGDQFGLFFIPVPKSPPNKIKCVCAPMTLKNGEVNEWQHVSVSLPRRCPTWGEMERVKQLFWGEDVNVVQYHPKKSEYVNNHPFTLHLWKHKDGHELPPSILVGVKSLEEFISLV